MSNIGKVSGYNSITYPNQVLVFEWCMISCGSKNRHPEEKFLQEIKLYAHICINFLGTIVNVIVVGGGERGQIRR